MKTMMLLLAASVALAASGSPAHAQGQGDACSPQYGSCMDRCTSRPKSLQETCAQMCEANTNRCYEGLYGTAQRDGQAAAAPSQDAEARAARDQVSPSDKAKRK